jgi:hypothetical protein
MRAPLAALLLGALLLATLPLPPAQAQAPPLPGAALPGPVFAYHTYETLTADLQALAAAHPERARLSSIGQSVLGRELWMLELGPHDADHAARPGFYLDAGHHGNEHLGIETAFQFAKRLLEEAAAGDADASALLLRNRIYVLPMLNPDGATHNSRFNANLVNLNRNYPFHWDERGTDPAPPGGNYAGPSAGSEPETQANMAFIEATDLDVYVSLHTGSYDIVRPFGYAPDEALPDEDLYQRFFAWAETEQGLEDRWPGGSGESICWAYGARGIFSLLFEVYDVPPTERAGDSQVLGGPLTVQEAEAAMAPHLASFRHLLEHNGKWGARVVAALDAVRGTEGVLVLRNEGFAAARDLAIAGTGLAVVGAVPSTLAPGEEARVAVRLDGPSQALVRYHRLAVQPEQDSPAWAEAEAVVEFRTTGIEPAATPGPGLLALLATAGLALALRRKQP